MTPLFDKPQFHFTDHAENGQNNLAHWASGIDRWIENTKAGAFGLKFVDDIQDVARGPAKAVRLDDY